MNNNIKDLIEQYHKLSNDIYLEQQACNKGENKIIIDLEQKRNDISEQIVQFSKSNDAYNTFTAIIEEFNPEAFSTMIANLDSNPNQYDTLYDLYKDFNNMSSNITFPILALQNVTIKLS